MYFFYRRCLYFRFYFTFSYFYNTKYSLGFVKAFANFFVFVEIVYSAHRFFNILTIAHEYLRGCGIFFVSKNNNCVSCKDFEKNFFHNLYHSYTPCQLLFVLSLKNSKLVAAWVSCKTKKYDTFRLTVWYLSKNKS